MIVVTGGAGFIGSALIWKLNNSGLKNILVVDDLNGDERWKNLVGLYFEDYVDKTDFLSMVKESRLPEIEAIVHMGACSDTTMTDAAFLMENNYRYSRTLATYALTRGIRYIQASSAATYGDGSLGFSDDHYCLQTLRPLNMYGYSKHLFDMWAWQHGLLDKLASLKFFNVFGPNEYHKGEMRSVICKAYGQIRATGSLKLFKSDRPKYSHGDQMRDFVYIKDCLNIICWLLENPQINGVFNVGSGTPATWNALAIMLFRAMNLPPHIEYIDMPENLKGRYQYYTKAEMEKLAAAGYDKKFSPLEMAVADYVGNYLSRGCKCLGYEQRPISV